MSSEELPITSSEEPAWAADAQQFYRDVMQALDTIPCAVGGAFAIHQHTGIWRATKDLDLLLPPTHVPRALAQLRRDGFETTIEDSVWLAKVMREEHFVDLITGLSNACIVVDESWIERAVPGTILDLSCKVLSPEELIASKIFITRRERFDGSDIVHLLRASAGTALDWDRILHLVGSHWQLLYWSLVLFAYTYPARTDLVPAHIWNHLGQRFTEQVNHPRKDAPFRGSLIDPLMFAIDVKEWGERNLSQEYRDRHPCLLRIEEEERKETNG